MSTNTTLPALIVELDDRRYPIYIDSQLLSKSDYLRSLIPGKQVLIVSNPNIADLYLDKLQSALLGLQVDRIIVPDGERYKNINECQRIWTYLLEQGHHRSTTLLALGGGVIGDLTGFAAACYQRGANFIQIPTSLLAQVDASVGGKTAVNHPLGKNMVGAFYQPKAVLIDLDTLNTLPKRHFAAGMAEVIKTALLFSEDFFIWLEKNMADILARDTKTLSEMIQRCCQHKATIVAADEREQSQRALLNLGHTYGHAIEQCSGYGTVLHGEAVALGLLLACHYAECHAQLDKTIRSRVQSALVALDLPVDIPSDLQVKDLLTAMQRDKKNQDAGICLILLKKIGQGYIELCKDPELIATTMQAYQA